MRRLAQRTAKQPQKKIRSTERRRTTRPAAVRSASSGGVQSIMLKMSRERVNQLARDLLDAMTSTHSVTLIKEREAVRQSMMTAAMPA